MKILPRCGWGFAVWLGCLGISLPAKPAPGEPGGPGEYRDFKVLKSYSAQAGKHLFRAFVIEWEGQEVVAFDPGALVEARSDDTINVLISRGLPRAGQTQGTILFLARPEKKPPVQSENVIPLDPEANPPLVVRTKVQKVYALRDSAYRFRAYEVQWQGNEVIVSDPSSKTNYAIGDTLVLLVTQHPYPDRFKPHGLLGFMIMPERPGADPTRR